MDRGLSLLFELTVVIVETFTIYLYLSGLFPSKKVPIWKPILGYGTFILLLGLASTLWPSMWLLPAITLFGVFALAIFLYEGHGLSSFFASFLYLVLCVVVEAVVPALQSLMLGDSLAEIHSFGAARMLSVVIAKLLMLLAVKLISTIMEKRRGMLHHRMLEAIPLIFCQIILIAVVMQDFIHAYQDKGEISAGALVEIVGIFFVNMVILWYFNLLAGSYELRYKAEISSMQLESQLRYYETIKSHQDTISAIEHDMKKHVQAIEAMAKDGRLDAATEYLEDFSQVMQDNMNLVFTPHPIVSSILTHCKQCAEREGIITQLSVALPETLEVHNIDLTVILGNTIDNALEALREMPDGARHLTINLSQSEHYLFYEAVNSFDPAASKVRNRRLSARGFGLNNVRACVEKYGGTLNITESEDTYQVSILIPSEAKVPVKAYF